jgi:hypothetical protein
MSLLLHLELILQPQCQLLTVIPSHQCSLWTIVLYLRNYLSISLSKLQEYGASLFITADCFTNIYAQNSINNKVNPKYWTS